MLHPVCEMLFMNTAVTELVSSFQTYKSKLNFFVCECNICAGVQSFNSATQTAFSGEFHMGPRDVVHDYVVLKDIGVLHLPVVLG